MASKIYCRWLLLPSVLMLLFLLCFFCIWFCDRFMCVISSFAIITLRKKIAGCFTLIVFLLLVCYGLVCDVCCGISLALNRSNRKGHGLSVFTRSYWLNLQS